MPQAVFSPSRKIAFFSFTSNWPTGRRPRATSHAFPCLPPCLQLLRPILPSRAINPVPSPFDLDFSPFAAFQLLRPPPSCYHWPMSPRTSNPPPPPPLSRAPLTGDQFPKWNGNSNRNIPKLRFAATHTKQSFGRFLIDTFRAFVPRAANFQPAPTNRRYYNSNHGTYEKLEVIENKGRKAILIKERSAASLPALAGDLLPSPASPTRNTAIRPTSSPCGPAIPPSSASAALSSAKSKASPPPAKFCSPPAATPAESKLRQTLR